MRHGCISCLGNGRNQNVRTLGKFGRLAENDGTEAASGTFTAECLNWNLTSCAWNDRDHRAQRRMGGTSS